MDISVMSGNLLPDIETYRQPYAKGTGDPSRPLHIVGSFEAKHGIEYNTFVGHDVFCITRQCGVSINKSPMVLLPERTAFIVSDTDFKVMFDRDLVVLKMNKQ